VRLVVTDRHASDVASDVIVIVFAAGRRKPRLPLPRVLPKDATDLVAREPDAMTWLEARRSRARRVLLVAAGTVSPDAGYCGSASDRVSEIERRHDQRSLGASILAALRSAGARSAVLASWPDHVDPCALVEGALLRAHSPRAWRDDHQSPKEKWTVCATAEDRGRLEATRALAESTNVARSLSDMPPNVGTPDEFVSRAQSAAAEVGLATRVIDPVEAGMGLFAAVARGGEHPPRLLVIEHNPDRPDDEVQLLMVGKGVTHDTGGYNLKSSGMHVMGHDKAGAAAVVGAMLAVARAKLPHRVVGLCPLAENLIGRDAYRPGDVIEAWDGTTVFIENTDAEGRLLLADTLAWGIDQWEPARVVDIATLTGASAVALADSFAALFSNDDGLRDAVVAAAERAGELAWPMPIHERHDRELAHPSADLRNVGAYRGAASAAAAFLRSFVGTDNAWVHLDIAGKAHNEHERDYLGPGATGWGTRLLFRLAAGLGPSDGD
jgi:leucyl aminopeptidase